MLCNLRLKENSTFYRIDDNLDNYYAYIEFKDDIDKGILCMYVFKDQEIVQLVKDISYTEYVLDKFKIWLKEQKGIINIAMSNYFDHPHLSAYHLSLLKQNKELNFKEIRKGNRKLVCMPNAFNYHNERFGIERYFIFNSINYGTSFIVNGDKNCSLMEKKDGVSTIDTLLQMVGAHNKELETKQKQKTI